MSKTSRPMEKHFTKGASEKHLKARSFRLVQVQLYVAKEGTFQIPQKCIDVTRTTHTNLDVLEESRIDDSWHVDEVHIVEGKTSLRICVAREAAYEDSSNYQTGQCVV